MKTPNTTYQFKLLTLYIGLIGTSFLSSCSKPVQEKKIAILPFSGFPETKTKLAAHELGEFYQCEVKVLQTCDLPKNAFIQVKSARYRADTLLRFLKTKRPAGFDHIVGLTHQDISFTKRVGGETKKPAWKYEDWGIMGLAHCPGTACVISDYRIGRSVKSSIAIDRFKKVLIHEVGHCLGLPHCTNEKCVMRDAAESVKTVDKVAFDLCKQCRRDINLN